MKVRSPGDPGNEDQDGYERGDRDAEVT